MNFGFLISAKNHCFKKQTFSVIVINIKDSLNPFDF